MVNYCCVVGCGRNNKTSKQIHYYGFPKDRSLQLKWLQAIGRKDLEKNVRLFNRVCSRHFSPSSIKNKHLCADAVPTLCLPNDSVDDSDETKEDNQDHGGIICNSCKDKILGFRYKCISCQEFDLCSKCERFEVHPEHCMLRIPTAMKFKIVGDLTSKWQQFLNPKNKLIQNSSTEDMSSDDDAPITKYIKYNNNLDVPEDMKAKIRNEVARVLSLTRKEPEKPVRRANKRKFESISSLPDTVQSDQTLPVEFEEVTINEDNEIGTNSPELAFADVNNIKNSEILDVKEEMPNLLTVLSVPESDQPTMDIKLSNELSELMDEFT